MRHGKQVAAAISVPADRTDEVLAARALNDLTRLALDMGAVIRAMDESGEHSEFWTQDGGYIIDSRFPK